MYGIYICHIPIIWIKYHWWEFLKLHQCLSYNFLSFFETGSQADLEFAYVAHSGLKLKVILLLQPLKCWNYTSLTMPAELHFFLLRKNTQYSIAKEERFVSAHNLQSFTSIVGWLQGKEAYQRGITEKNSPGQGDRVNCNRSNTPASPFYLSQATNLFPGASHTQGGLSHCPQAE